MKITDLTPEMAQCAFEEFWDEWLATWDSARQLQGTPRTSYTYFKGFMADDAGEEGNQ